MAPEKPRTIFFSVGEPSGDLHGANLVELLKKRDPSVRVVGFGGPRMQKAGMSLLADLTQLAVMWFAQALLNIQKFWNLLKQADHYFKTVRPDAVVLIDYPGFNWWVARKAKKLGIPVFYYGVPQLWAWGRWRIRKMQRFVDFVLCKLPFEAQWYQQHGCQAVFLGHPYFDELTENRSDQEFIGQVRSTPTSPLVTILPGSRTQEVESNLKGFLQAAELISREVPRTRFAIASFNEKQAAHARKEIAKYRLPVEIFVGRTGELIQASRCCLACSGSVSLELMYHAKPSVIHYRVTRSAYFLGRTLIRVKYVTLVNLLACDDRFDLTYSPYHPDHPGAHLVPFPEYPTYQDKSAQMAADLVGWLQDPDEYQRRVDQLIDLKSRFCATGATRAAADFIMDKLQPVTAARGQSPRAA